MKKLITITSTVLLLMVVSSADAYITGAAYTWAPGTPGYNPAAILHPGIINPTLLAPGDFVGRGLTGAIPNAVFWGDSGVSVGWDDAWVGNIGNANTNGDALDGLWVQIYADGGLWDMGTPTSTVAVFTSQDHGPYLGEGLEYRIFASNDLVNWTAQILVSHVYMDGWRAHNPNEDSNGNLWLSDDIGGVYNLGGSYRYIYLQAWGASPYDEPEVDAVAAIIPAPAAILLGGLGVGVFGWLRRRKDI